MPGIHRPTIQDIGLADRPVARFTAVRPESGRHDPLGTLGAAVRSAAGAVGRWRARRVARTDLNAMPDWALADIGLARSDIPRVAEAIADTLYAAGPGANGKPPKITVQSALRDAPRTGRLRVVSGGSPELACCG